MHFGMAVSILVGWNETNRRFPLVLKVVREDGDELLSVSAQIEAGRPPGLPAGADIRSVLAVNAEVQFPRLGSYEFRAELNGKVRSTSFRVRGPAGNAVRHATPRWRPYISSGRGVRPKLAVRLVPPPRPITEVQQQNAATTVTQL